MFCPNCRYEYKKGIKVCPDCDENLVDTLPPDEEEHDEEDKYANMVTVYETSDQSKILIAKSLLEEAGIEFFAQGDGIMDLFGAGRLGFNPVVGPVYFKVREEDEDRALEILVDMMDTDDDDDNFDDNDYDDEEDEEDDVDVDDDYDIAKPKKKYLLGDAEDEEEEDYEYDDGGLDYDEDEDDRY